MKPELRYACHPEDFKGYDTEKLRKEFLIENIFIADEISLVYSMYDRYIVGGAMPVKNSLKLESIDELKAETVSRQKGDGNDKCWRRCFDCYK